MVFLSEPSILGAERKFTVGDPCLRGTAVRDRPRAAGNLPRRVAKPDPRSGWGSNARVSASGYRRRAILRFAAFAAVRLRAAVLPEPALVGFFTFALLRPAALVVER